MLYRSKPAGLRLKPGRAIIEQVIVLKLLGFLAIVNDWTGKRVRIDVEHRALLRFRITLNLCIFSAAPQSLATIRDFLLDRYGIAAAPEVKPLVNDDAFRTLPPHRHDQLVGAVQPVRVAAAREHC